MDAPAAKIDDQGRYIINDPEEADALALYEDQNGKVYLLTEPMLEAKCGPGGILPPKIPRCENPLLNDRLMSNGKHR